MDNTHIPVTLKRAFLGALLIVPMLAMAQNSDSRAITAVLNEAKKHAVLAEEDAATLESYTLSSLSWQTHANRLNLMNEHATDLINEFNQLSSLRSKGSPWQQEAIDRINPLLHEMADNLTATLNYLNENQKRVQMPPFQNYVRANHELISKTTSLISDLVDYGEARAKADNLENSLDLPSIAHE